MGVRKWWAMGLGLCALVAVDAGVARAQVAMSQSNQKKTFDCGGKDAQITGSMNELTLKGECTSVTILGSSNTVGVESVEEIHITGTGNKVTWQKTPVEKGPMITKSGLNNVVTQAKPKAQPGAPAMAADAAPAGDPAPAPAAKMSASKSSAGSTKSAAGKPAAAPKTSAAASTSSPKSSGGPAIEVSDEKSTRTIDCRGRGVAVLGNSNRLTLRGTCGTVDVKGNDNIISVDTVQAIAATGNHNRVTWSRAAEGEQPSVSDLGNENAIRRAAAPPQ
jgi:hypothetical protein